MLEFIKFVLHPINSFRTYKALAKANAKNSCQLEYLSQAIQPALERLELLFPNDKQEALESDDQELDGDDVVCSMFAQEDYPHRVARCYRISHVAKYLR